MNRSLMNPNTPGSLIQSMFREMARPWGMDDSMVRRLSNPWRLAESDFAGLDMRLDVVDKKDSYEVRADLPGAKKEDIQVRIDGNVVSIKVHSQEEHDVKDGKVICNERSYGTLSRSFTLDQEVDDSKATGKYADGVLTLDLPKKAPTPETQARQIAIS